MHTFGLNLFGGGSGGTVYKYIGPNIDIETHYESLGLEIEIVGITVDTQVQEIAIDHEVVDIAITRNPDGFIIG